MLVEQKEVGHGVVGDEEIHPAIVVDVGRDYSPGLAFELGDAAGFRDVGEGAVAVVMEQPAGGRLVEARNAVVAFAADAVAAGTIVALGVLNEVADEEIEVSIVVVVKPGGAGGPAVDVDAGLGGDVGEGGRRRCCGRGWSGCNR